MKPVNLSLKNGDSHELQSVNIFIGPNNSGKSLLLREIQSTYGVTKLFDEIHFDSIPDVDHIKSLMDETSQYNVFRSGNSISLQNWENAKQYIENDSIRQTHWEKHYRHNSVILNGRERLSIVNNQSYKGATAAPENSFSMLRTNQNLKDKVQKYISNVYPNDYFCLWNESQGSLTAYLAQEEPENNIEHFDSADAVEFFQSKAKKLSDYSDGVAAYIGILVSTIAEDKPVFIIDEPEAFLHPSLAYQLGKTISDICHESEKSCFIATHSSHILKGCLSIYPNACSITRLDYKNEVSTSNSLDSTGVKSIIQDPLLSNIGVTEALFHTRVIVVEGDSDRAFYSEINNRLIQSKSGGIPDCLFINARNKQTIAKILKLLRKIGISCVAITDIDVFKEGGTNYSNITSALDTPTGTFETLRNTVHRALVAAAETDYKREGGIELLSDDEERDATALIRMHAEKGWFIVPHGEVEQWLGDLDIGRGKSVFLANVFGKMGSDPDDANYMSPPETLDDVWRFIENISEWFSQNG